MVKKDRKELIHYKREKIADFEHAKAKRLQTLGEDGMGVFCAASPHHINT